MKKIIKHGEIPSTVRRFKCLHCGCIFEADRDEYESHFDRNEEFWSSSCPECNHVANSYLSRKGQIYYD